MTGVWTDWLRLLRLNQWTKNAVVFAAFVFASGDRNLPHVFSWENVVRVLLAAFAFGLVSSGVYAINDVADREADRRHPVKRNRPVAAGRIAPLAALLVSAALIATGLATASPLSPALAGVLAVYVVMQGGYSLGLKRVALLDVFVISAGFVLRAAGGAFAIHVHISPWLLLCAFVLSLFLALCKRRHEKRLLGEEEAGSHRASLEGYEEGMLDQLISVSAGATIVCYSIYTLWPDTVGKFGSHALGLTIPFVVFGVFRYMDLVYRRDQGGRPERVLLTDGPLIGSIVLYGLTVGAVFLLGR
jgi:4-hydroxybenzoate polyprenyltransferase